MSTKRSFGRFTAMGLAGLTAVSSVAIVAEAASIATNVYEFAYKGIDSVAPKASAALLLGNNDFITDPAENVVSGFTATVSGADYSNYGVKNFTEEDYTALDSDTGFGLYTNYATLNTQDDGTTWTYMTDGTVASLVVAEEQYATRDADASSSGTSYYYFKTKAERDAAITKIEKAITSEYTTKYNAAKTALSNDLSKANDAMYNKNLKDAKTIYDAKVEEIKKTFENATTDLKSTDDAYKEAKETRDEDLAAAKKAYEATKKVISANKTARASIAKTIVAEFAEKYQPSNFVFNDKTVFVKDDSATEVTMTIIGGTVEGNASYTSVTGGDGLDLTTSYYRTTDAYTQENRYAFKGEIIEGSHRTETYYEITGWVKFTDYVEGSDSSSGSSSSGGSSDSSSSSSTTTSSGDWYPSNSAYRSVNTSGISYQGNNGKWYTSSSAASLYGEGYSGVSKTSNYSDVSSNSTLYFSADDGNYYKTASSAGSHSYVVKESSSTSTTDTSTTDPYYYYYLSGTTTSTTTTDPDAPTIYGSTKRSGWTKITSVINASSTGSTVKISMNGTYTVPASVLEAAKNRSVNLLLVNSNGSKVTIKAGNVSTSSAINVGITYNVSTIKSSLVKAAKKVNSGTVSTAQIQVGNDGSLGGTVTTTVKLSTKRAGDTVKAYRLSNGKLVREATGTVQSTGALNLNLKNGGTYLLVVIE